MLVAVAAFVAMFFAIPTPSDVAYQPAFSVQGYLPDAGKTLTERPQFVAETATTRPEIHISMVTSYNGECAIAQTETVNSTTSFEILDKFEVKAKVRAYDEVIFPGREDLAGTDWEGLTDTRIRFVVVCKPSDGNSMLSSFYEVSTKSSDT